MEAKFPEINIPEVPAPDGTTIILNADKKLEAKFPEFTKPDECSIRKTKYRSSDPLRLVNVDSIRPYRPDVWFLKDFDFDLAVTTSRIELRPRNSDV